jgi:hypothetical protein
MATPDASAMSDNWVVVTSINPPTDCVKKFGSLPGWKVVVIGDKKSPKDWKFDNPNVVYLSLEAQKKLGYRLVDLTPEGIYARKNIGNLYAIQHGAKFIFETDDDNVLTEDSIVNYMTDKSFQVFHTKNRFINPYPNFGQPTVWPRGYPLNLIGAAPVEEFTTQSNVKVLVQQGLANGDPDVDAVFRLSRKKHSDPIRIYFDNSKPCVVLPRHSYAP